MNILSLNKKIVTWFFIIALTFMWAGHSGVMADSMLSSPGTGGVEGDPPETIEELSSDRTMTRLSDAGTTASQNRIWGPACKSLSEIAKNRVTNRKQAVKKYPPIQVRYRTYLGRSGNSRYGRQLSSRGTRSVVLVNITPVIIQEAQKNKISPLLLKAIIETESGYNNYAVGGSALGLCQMVPSTARSMGVKDPFNPYQNIAGGAKYLGMLMRRYRGNMDLAIAAYNLGPGSVGHYVPSCARPFVRTVRRRMHW